MSRTPFPRACVEAKRKNHRHEEIVMTEPTRPLPELIDITTVAKILGVDARHVRRLVYERRIPIIKWGHLVRFDPDDIAEWINGKRRGPSNGLPAP
jgi:excisionase family DNA binding protein